MSLRLNCTMYLSPLKRMCSALRFRYRIRNNISAELCGMLCISESVVTYSAPRGEAESSLEDLSYDGNLDGGHMRGGLGQLVDGLFGDDHIQDHTPGKLTSVSRDSY
jgi:hypothetical protein